jgi:SAM-dependent methyltransferase
MFGEPEPAPRQANQFASCLELLDVLMSLGFLRRSQRSQASYVASKWIHTIDLSRYDPTLCDSVFVATDLPGDAKGGTDSVFQYADEGQIAIECAYHDIVGLDPSPNVMDLCCGAGTIGLQVGKIRDDAKVYCVDESQIATEQAQFNVELNDLDPSRFEFRNGHLFEEVDESEKFDLIFADPPFSLLPPFVKSPSQNHGGQYGDAISHDVLENASRYLKPTGKLILLTYSLGKATLADSLRVSIPESFDSLEGGFRRAAKRVWRFNYEKAFPNPMPLEYLAMRLADKTRRENILSKSSERQAEVIQKYIDWIEKIKERQGEGNPKYTHLWFLISKFGLAT